MPVAVWLIASKRLAQLAAASRAGAVSPIAVYEAVLGVARRLRMSAADAETAVDLFLSQTETEIIPITGEISRGAVAAFVRFGRGRHPAALNLGDCLAYACARALGVPLLFKGDDFAQTDIA